jgi:hypothetical protein
MSWALDRKNQQKRLEEAFDQRQFLKRRGKYIAAAQALIGSRLAGLAQSPGNVTTSNDRNRRQQGAERM